MKLIIGILFMGGFAAGALWLIFKWAKFCGFGKGYPFPTKIRTLFGSEEEKKSNYLFRFFSRLPKNRS